MELNRPATLGDLEQSSNYNGRHRAFGMKQGTAFIGLGDRNRCKPEYGIEMVEDRDSDPNIRRI